MNDAISPTRIASARPAPRPAWLRYLVYAAMAVIGVFLLLLVIGILAGKPEKTDVTAALRTVAADHALAAKHGFDGTMGETTPAAAGTSPGFQTNFHWLPGPDGLIIDIETFDTLANAETAFALFKTDTSKSLLLDPEEGVVVTGSFSKGKEGRPYRQFHCAQRRYEYSCGSMTPGLPAIVVIRMPFAADWQQRDDRTADDPMAGMERMFARSDAQAKAAVLVDHRLHALGLPVELPEGEK